MFHSRTHIRVAVMAAMTLVLPAFAYAQAAATLSSADSALLAHVAVMARQRSTALLGDRAAGNAASAATYREALADIDRGELATAATALTAALARARDNALYRGDLAYVYARLGRFEDASTEYTRAYQALQGNAWYLVGIAVVKAAQGQFPDAAGAVQLAASNDSAVVDSITVGPAASWFGLTSDRAAALAWARLAVAKNPNDPKSYLAIARVLAQRGDSSGEGGAAIASSFRMHQGPADPLASALWANDVYRRGQLDSAIALMRNASSDSLYRRYLALYYIEAATRASSGRITNADSGLALLRAGREFADSATLIQYRYLTGRVQLMKLQVELNDTTRSCDIAHHANALADSIQANLREGAAADSSRANLLLNAILPGFKQNAQAAVTSCRQPGATPARRPAPAPRRRP